MRQQYTTRPPRRSAPRGRTAARDCQSRNQTAPGISDMANVWRDMATSWFDAVDSFTDVLGRDTLRSARAWMPTRYDQNCRCGADPCRCGQARCDHGYDPCSCDGPCTSCNADPCCCPPNACRGADCHCQCCITDADLVVHMRVGETRVVPLQIENPRNRKREIGLDLSEFTRSGGSDAPVQAHIEQTSFVLEACEDHLVTLVLSIPSQGFGGETPSGRGHDVDDCLVAYADLRIKGCDIRPIRIAVAVQPLDCDPFQIRCGCGCC